MLLKPLLSTVGFNLLRTSYISNIIIKKASLLSLITNLRKLLRKVLRKPGFFNTWIYSIAISFEMHS